MILDAIFAVFEAVVVALMTLFPSIPFPIVDVGQLAPLWGGLGWVNHFLPIDQMLLGFGAVATAWVALQAFYFAEWVLSKAHILGGGA